MKPPWSRPRVRPAPVQELLAAEDADGAVPALKPRPRTGALPRLRLGGRLWRPVPIAGVVLLVIAAAGYRSLAGRPGARTPVVAGARSLPAGASLRPSDLRVARVGADPGTLAALVPAAKLPQLIGRRLAGPLAAGAPLTARELVPAGRAPAAFTLAVPLLHALGGALHPGDRVSVLATYTSPSGQASSRAVARGLLVLAVGAPPSGLDAASATIAVTVALPNPSVAAALALANEQGKIDLLRDGQGAGAPIPPATQAGAG